MKTKRRKPRQYLWSYGGGGCLLAAANDGAKYPCDDTYVNRKTKREVVFRSTVEAHFNMPDFVDDIRNIARRKGVQRVK
jgi:hypothetical protein